jgi:hypothetical protein
LIKNTGRVDLTLQSDVSRRGLLHPGAWRYRVQRSTRFAGGQNTAAVEDVAYIQKKLFAALKIPRAYLGYDELLEQQGNVGTGGHSFLVLSTSFRKTMMAELNKLAIIHLYAHGFDGGDLQNFTLRLSNPSTVAQQQKLELWRAKFEIAGSAPEGTASKKFIRHEIWGLNEEQIEQMDDERLKEKLVDSTIEAAGTPGVDETGEEAGGTDLFGGGGGSEETGGTSGGEEAEGGETPPEENAGEEPEEETDPGRQLLTGGDDPGDEENFALKLKDINDKPVKISTQLDRVLYNRGRRRTHGASKTHMPDFVKMTGNKNHAMEDPYDNDWMKSVVTNPFAEGAAQPSRPVRLPQDVVSTLKKLTSRPDWKKTSDILQEGKDVQDEIDAGNGDLLDLDLVESASLSGEQLNEDNVNHTIPWADDDLDEGDDE